MLLRWASPVNLESPVDTMRTSHCDTKIYILYSIYFYVFFKNLKIHTDHFPSGINLQVFRKDTQSVLFEVLTGDLYGCIL